MAATPKDLEALHAYANGVMDRAWHHAGEVRGVALALLGAVIWRGDPDSIRLRSYDGSPANMLWVSIGGTRYVLAYNHDTLKIELRDRTQTGPVLHTFDDATATADVYRIFAAL
jgi:hypothetical protein